jgi:hypothetical protein
MASGSEFDRIGVRMGEDYRVESGRNGAGRDDSNLYHAQPQPAQGAREPLERAVGSPLPMGSSGKSPLPGRGDANRSSPPPGRALSVTSHSDAEQSSGMQWALGVFKQAVPFVQKLLPLLDGQVASAVANLLTARPHTPPPPPRVDLQPIENSLADLQIQQGGFKEQLADQNASLKRVEDHLEMVREATDRNTLEQQELIEDLKTMGNRVNLLALLFLGLLVISVLLNLFLFLHIQRVLP